MQGSDANDLTRGQQKSLSTGVGLPPFRVRDLDFISVDLGASALPLSPIAIPIYTFAEHTLENDLSTSSCSYISKTESPRKDNDACFGEDGQQTQADIMPCVIQNFNLTQEEGDDMNFHEAYHFSDALTADQYDGIPINCEFTEKTWSDVKHMQKIYLSNIFTDEARDLHISRIFSKPLAIMQDKVD